MLTITTLEDAYLIENMFIFGNEVWDDKYLILKPHANADDILATMKKGTIDFPGEYDINTVFIKAVLGKKNEMNYFIKTKNKSFAIIQSPEVLEQDDLLNVQHRIVTHEKVANKIDQLELEGEKIDISTLSA